MAVASQYSHEAYDYPPNIRESFNDLGRTISEKVTLLSHAGSAADAQAALTAPPSAAPQPKTFNHALARAALASSQALHSSHTAGAQPAPEDALAQALEKYALAQERVGEARRAQDQQVQARFLAGWSTTLNTNLVFAQRARKAVENARLSLDAAKARAKGQAAGRGFNTDDEHLSAHARAEIEQKEDEFVSQTEEAVGVMKNVSWGYFPFPLRVFLFRLRCLCMTRLYTTMSTIQLTGMPRCTVHRHARASAQPGRPDRRPARVPPQGLRDPQRAGARRRRPAGRAGGQLSEG